MNIIKSLFAFLVMLVATLFTASHAQAFALGNHAGGFFLGTLDCNEENKPSTRNLCRENGWLNYDTLSGCSVATNKISSETTTVSKFFPSNDGFLGSSQRTFLEQGQLIDRIGLDKGKFFSPAGTPIPNRALRPGTEGGPLSTFRVLKPFEVNSGTIAPAFNRPGLGTQFQSPVSAEVLLKRGIIERVP